MEVKMKTKNLTLTQLVKKSFYYLKQKNYSKTTINNFKSTWNQLIKYANSNEIYHYTYSFGEKFIVEHYGIDPKQKKISSYHRYLFRTIKILDEIQTFGFVKTKKTTKPLKNILYFKETLQLYIENLNGRNLSLRTIEKNKFIIRKLLLFLEKEGVKDLFELTHKKIYDYLDTQKSLARTTKESNLYIIRRFIRFLASQNKCKKELARIFPVISLHSNDKIPSFFSTDEIKKVLDCIDNSSKIGKRDYAIILLAVQLGIRAGDIRNLKMENINWNNKCIQFIQKKTGIYLELPLSQESILALLDYLKNSRPKSNSQFVFIRTIAPYTEYSSCYSFYNIVQKYLKKAKIEYKTKHHGLHSFRYSLANNMLSDGTPMPIITNILGHKYSDTTNHYIKINIKQLKKVALEVPPYAGNE
jgi:integrase